MSIVEKVSTLMANQPTNEQQRIADLERQVVELTKERNEWKSVAEHGGMHNDTVQQLAAVVQQRDELQKDAERYRFLKATGSIVVDWMPLLSPEEDSYDAAIDAAIAKAQP